MTGVCGDFLLRIEPPTANFFGGTGPFQKREKRARKPGAAIRRKTAEARHGQPDPTIQRRIRSTGPLGNPYPDGDGKHRPGDDLYTNSILALNPADGKLKWFYQVTPHDVNDWDTTAPLVLVDTVYRGEPRKLLMHVDKNGFFYVLDRTDGHVLLAKPAVRVTWASGIGADGRPQRVPDHGIVCPAIGSNWNAAAYSPVTRLYYVMVIEGCDVDMAAENAKSADEQTPKKYLEAINIQDGKIVWRIRQLAQRTASVMPGSWQLQADSYFMATQRGMWLPPMLALENHYGTLRPMEKIRPHL